MGTSNEDQSGMLAISRKPSYDNDMATWGGDGQEVDIQIASSYLSQGLLRYHCQCFTEKATYNAKNLELPDERISSPRVKHVRRINSGYIRVHNLCNKLHCTARDSDIILHQNKSIIK
ncbi:uncharacterized protein LOC116206064 [Punica granatum]|uniref:Uncharacterized protein LOC116206064 n=1 Tax=Punica granatum TaxID=22663 RepID=A0A6P8DRJ2_PUNGR|nr:uncharacterized protein LOC116206064 [Punica granatum]